jgi:hypothetical protein
MTNLNTKLSHSENYQNDQYLNGLIERFPEFANKTRQEIEEALSKNEDRSMYTLEMLEYSSNAYKDAMSIIKDIQKQIDDFPTENTINMTYYEREKINRTANDLLGTANQILAYLGEIQKFDNQNIRVKDKKDFSTIRFPNGLAGPNNSINKIEVEFQQ